MQSTHPPDHDGDATSPGAVRPARGRGLREQLGLPEVRYRDEAGMPPVDENMLRLLVGRGLRDDVAAKVFESVENYQPWAEAYARILIEEFRGGRGSGGLGS